MSDFLTAEDNYSSILHSTVVGKQLQASAIKL